MNEPLRWLEDESTATSLLQVLEAAPRPPEMPRDAESKLGAFASGLTSSGTAATVVGAKATLLGLSGAGKISLVIAMLGAAGTAGYSVVDQKVARDGQSKVTRIASRAARSLPVPVVVEPIAVKNGSDEVSAGSRKVERPKGRVLSAVESDKGEIAALSDTPVDVASSAVAAFESPSLAAEARLLESARAALGTEPAQTLEIVQQHQRLYPDGQLAAERELLAVDALLRLGQRAEAVTRAAPRLRQAPDSLYARRLRQLLAIEPP